MTPKNDLPLHGDAEVKKENVDPAPPLAAGNRDEEDEPTAAKELRNKTLSVAGPMNFNIPADHHATTHVKEHHGHNSWEYKVLKFLHQKKVQTFLGCLLVLDVVLLFTELALLTVYPACSIIERDAISCCPTTEDYGYRVLAGEGKKYYECAADLTPSFQNEATCDDHKWHKVHRAEDAMFIMTMIILSVFLLELTATMIALKPQVYFRQAFYALDYFIVTVSIVLEATFFSLDDTVTQSLVGLIIVIRAWRFVRISHGIVEVVAELSHEHYEDLLAYCEELEEILKANNFTLPTGKICPHNHSANQNSLVNSIEEHRRLKKRQRHLSPAESNVSQEHESGSQEP